MYLKKLCRIIFISATLWFFLPRSGFAFSILAHEAIIDAEWEHQLKPLLLSRYPGITPEQLKTAHAYAYGGCLMPDMGYMPLGNPYFTDLVHYVRSGEFVMELLTDARDINEYAFALGAISHYMADKFGHSMATNRTVPILYPDLKKKFGDVVTYADDNGSHSRVEFAFDVVQVAKGSYASTAYHDFIGFNMSERLLDEAFKKIYCEDLNTVFSDFSSTVATFRWGVRDLFPRLVRKAWNSSKDSIRKGQPGITRGKFRYRMPVRMFKKEFGTDYKRPDFKARLIVFLIRILPKIGPLKKLKFLNPGPEGEKYFTESMDTILTQYSYALKKTENNTLSLTDIDFDTGRPTYCGEYPLADETYSYWLQSLQKQDFRNVNGSARQNILQFYEKADTASAATQNPGYMQKAMTAVGRLKAIAAN